MTRLRRTFIICALLAFTNCSGQPKEAISAYSIEEILQMENPTEAITELDTKLNEISEYAENIDVLSDAEKVVLFVENLEREINNGGFNQFFWNSSGNFAHETLAALKSIGATKTAEIVSRAYAEWPDTIIPSARLERQTVLEEIQDKAQATWSNCDTQFYEYEDDISSLLFIYVKANKSEFN